MPGYREGPDVRPDSNTETNAAVKVLIDNWRWADVPFYLRSGKRLAHKVSEIAIRFKSIPHRLFGDAARRARQQHAGDEDTRPPNKRRAALARGRSSRSETVADYHPHMME